MAGFSPVTYAILKKKITSALTGIKDIFLDKGTGSIVFVTEDSNFPIKVPAVPDKIHIGPDTPFDDEIQLWIDTSDDSPITDGPADASAVLFTNKPVTTTTVGSLKAGTDVNNKTAKELFEMMLWAELGPKISATWKFASSPYPVYVTDAKGNKTKLDAVNLGIIATKGSYPIVEVTVERSDIGDKTKLNTDIITTAQANFDWVDADAIEFNTINKGNITYTVIAKDEKGEVATTNKKIKFVEKKYIGYFENGFEINEENIKEAIAKEIVKDENQKTIAQLKVTNITSDSTANYDYSGITMEMGRVVYIYPKKTAEFPNGYDKLTSIKDKSGFELLNGETYSKTPMEIKLNGIDYYVYSMTDPVGAEGDMIHKFR